MKKIQLDRRDRKAINREDAENVITGSCSVDEIAVDLEPTFIEASRYFARTGERYAYIVIRVERD